MIKKKLNLNMTVLYQNLFHTKAFNKGTALYVKCIVTSFLIGPRRDKTCFWGFQKSETLTTETS